MRFKKLELKSSKTLKNYILIISCVFLVIIFVYTNIIISVRKAHEGISESFKETQFENIMLYYDELQISAYNNAVEVAENIEADIRANVNLTSLKEDMDNGIIPDEVYDILEENCLDVNLGHIDNTRNGIVVISNDKILIDNNYGRASIATKDVERNIEGDRNFNWNKPLYDNAITKIFNKSNSDDIIAIETFESSNKNHIQIKTATYLNLKEVFMKEGVHGLRNYQFFVPAYITEYGDIFGQDDINQGILQENHKFIILQEFNIFDQIQRYHLEFLLNNEETALLAQHETAVNILYILGITLIASYIIVVVAMVNTHNTAVLREHNDEN